MSEVVPARAGSKLRFVGKPFPLVGRYLAAGLGSVFVIPAPWLGAWLLHWLADQTEVEDGTELTFEGRAGEIWLPIILYVVLGFAGAVPGLPPGIQMSMPLLMIPVGVFLLTLIIRWLVGAGRVNGSSLTFVGSYWSLLGYYLLYFVSIFTIIGWAWVVAAGIRWFYRSIEGDYVFSFTAKGHEILWRTVVTGLACILIIPIPWILIWMTKWYCSQTTVEATSQGNTAPPSVEPETQE